MLYALFTSDLLLLLLFMDSYLSFIVDFKIQKNAAIAQLRDCLLTSNIDMEHTPVCNIFFSIHFS